MLAAPQPSFSCFTKGTSSQSAGAAAAAKTCPQQQPREQARASRGLMPTLPNRHDDQNQGRNRHNDESAGRDCHIAGGKVCLRLLRARGQLRQLGVAQRGDAVVTCTGSRCADFIAFCALSEERNCFTCSRFCWRAWLARHSRFLQIGRAYHVRLRQKAAWERQKRVASTHAVTVRAACFRSKHIA